MRPQAARRLRLSLKGKLALAMSALAVLLMTLFSAVIFAFFRAELVGTIEHQQDTLVSGLAGQIDEKLAVTRNVVATMATTFPRGGAVRPDRIRRFLDGRLAAFPVFTRGFGFYSPTGRLLVTTSGHDGRSDGNLATPEEIRRVAASGRPLILPPHFSATPPDRPAITFAAPVIAGEGHTLGVLCGGVDLMQDAFLGALARIRIARHGYLCLYNADGTILMHPDSGQVLRGKWPAGADRPFRVAHRGAGGAGAIVTVNGIPMVASFHHLTQQDWLLAAYYPESAAYAPIARARRYWLVASIAVGIVSIAVIWLFVRYLTAPIEALSGQMETISRGGSPVPVLITTSDEIADLSATFNRMMTSLAVQQEELNKLSRAVEQSPSIVVITDPGGTIEYVNPKFTEVTGFSREEAVGQNPRILKSGELAPEVYRQMWETIRGGGEWRGEFHNRRKDGSLYWAAASISAVRNEAGEITHFIGVQENVTQRKELEARLVAMALHDNLTGLANRNLLQDLFLHELAYAGRDQRLLVVLFIDLDRFKEVNDTFGHAVGDLLLRKFAAILTASVRRSDTVARLGGDEFIVLLNDVGSPEDAAVVAQKILAAIAAPLDLDGTRVTASASIGISVYPTDGTDDETLIRNADLAMYHAKEYGRNTYLFFSPQMRQTIV